MFRPDTLDNYIGQTFVRKNLETLLAAAKSQNKTVAHTLVYGPPGTGKTTIARIIANETGSKLHTVIGPALRTVADLISVLRQIKAGDVLFIDEIHALPRIVEEVLYTAMEDWRVDIVVGENVRLNLSIALPRFTTIGATTRVSKITEPLRARFGATFRLEYYSIEDLVLILNQANAELKINATPEGLAEVAQRGRGTPRIALKMLERAGDYASVVNSVLDSGTANDALEAQGVDHLGLNQDDRDYLTALIKRFNGGPAGVLAIAAVMNREESDLDSMIEPWLMKLGFIDRTPRGRVATEAAYNHMGFEYAGAEAQLIGR
jgi:holliday junction DNA helicase RuvB